MQSVKPTGIQLDITANLQKWCSFVAVAELGSLTRAALHLDSSQSMLSRQINALERECNARLFVRTGRGVELSEVGQRLLPHVKSLLAGAQFLEQQIHGGARLPFGTVTIGLLPSTAHPLIGELFKRVRVQFPEVHLRILEGSSGQVEEWLADARVDIAILYRYSEEPPPMETALAIVDSYLIGARGDALTAGNEVPFESLDGLPYILPGAPNGLRNALDAIARREKVRLEPVIEADSLPLMRSVVASEKLYSVLPLHAVWTEVAEGRLQAARVVDPPLRRIVSMAMSKTKGPDRAVAEVGSLIEAIVEDLGRQGLWQPTGAQDTAAQQGITCQT